MRTNVFVRDLNIMGIRPTDGRRIEIVADGLSLFHSAQLVIDTTIVCPVGRDGTAYARAADEDGVYHEAACHLHPLAVTTCQPPSTTECLRHMDMQKFIIFQSC